MHVHKHVHELHQQDALLMSANFILLQLPNVCHFQDLNYTIIIKRIQPSHDTNTGDIVIGPKTVRGQTEVHEVINSRLVVNAVYSVLVDMNTVTMSISSNSTFSKLPTVIIKTKEKIMKIEPLLFHNLYVQM